MLGHSMWAWGSIRDDDQEFIQRQSRQDLLWVYSGQNIQFQFMEFHCNINLVSWKPVLLCTRRDVFLWCLGTTECPKLVRTVRCGADLVPFCVLEFMIQNGLES